MNPIIFHISSNECPQLQLVSNSQSYHFHHFDTCKSAKEQLKNTLPHIIIADWFVKDCQGWALVSEFAKFGRATLCVLLLPNAKNLDIPPLPENAYVWRLSEMQPFTEFIELVILNHYLRTNRPETVKNTDHQHFLTLDPEQPPLPATATQQINLIDSLQFVQHAHLLQTVKTGLVHLKENTREASLKGQINQLIRLIDTKGSTNLYWQMFQASFQELHANFFSTLKKKYPELTPYELRLCAMIRLNLSNEDMADIMGVAAKSINVAKYRLRKKTGMGSTDDFLNLLLSI